MPKNAGAKNQKGRQRNPGPIPKPEDLPNNNTTLHSNQSQIQSPTAPLTKSQSTTTQASENVEEQRSTSAEIQRKSSAISDHDTNQIKDDKSLHANQVPFSTVGSTGQPTFNNSSSSSFQANEPITEESTRNNQQSLSSQAEQISSNLNEIPANVKEDDENQQVFHQDKMDTTGIDYYSTSFFFIMNTSYFHIGFF